MSLDNKDHPPSQRWAKFRQTIFRSWSQHPTLQGYFEINTWRRKKLWAEALLQRVNSEPCGWPYRFTSNYSTLKLTTRSIWLTHPPPPSTSSSPLHFRSLTFSCSLTCFLSFQFSALLLVLCVNKSIGTGSLCCFFTLCKLKDIYLKIC